MTCEGHQLGSGSGFDLMKKLALLLLSLLPAAAGADERPNILFIFCDDHATQAISAYGHEPKLNSTPNIDSIAEGGMLFRRCLVTNSICAPSRAVVLTGQYSHVNGQMTNKDTFDGSQQTAPKLLQAAGYQTAIVGKWHLKSEPTGFDHFEVLKGQGQYYNPAFRTKDGIIQHEGYTTDIITERALDWLKTERDPDKPFLLMCQHKAPHGRWEPAIRHLELFDEIEIPEPASLFDDYAGRSKAPTQHAMGIADHMGEARLMFKYSSKHTPEQLLAFDAYFKPRNEAFLEANLQGDARTKWHYQRYIKNYLRCVQAVDEGVGDLLAYLDDADLADNTVVIYMSDQGFYLGEHGWFDKRWMYEESLRTPLLVRWPGVTPEGTVQDEYIVSNLDIAETWLEIAGAEIPEDMHGRSLVPLFSGETVEDWRSDFYYHYYEAGGHGVPLHFGVTDGTNKLIRFIGDDLDATEFYDLDRDPNEMRSEFTNPEYAGRVRELEDRIKHHQQLLGIQRE
ncbi:MAG: arylsulfatase A-like enzyme [Verrucomicrobiales bacterium]